MTAETSWKLPTPIGAVVGIFRVVEEAATECEAELIVRFDACLHCGDAELVGIVELLEVCGGLGTICFGGLVEMLL